MEKPSFRELVRLFGRIGLISFGGPAGQIALMHKELVEERRWIGEQRFLHALNYCMLLPGPEAQQLATYVGWLMHRTLGGLIAGLLFVLPGAFVMLGLSILYAFYRHVPLIDAVFFGVKAAVLAVVVEAVLRIGKRALKNRIMIGIAILLASGEQARYRECLVRSAWARLHQLRCAGALQPPARSRATSFGEGLFDALAAGHWRLAHDIAEACPPGWIPEGEYEDDFCHVRLIGLYTGDSPPEPAAVQALLDRHAQVLDGARTPRLALGRALYARDADERAAVRAVSLDRYGIDPRLRDALSRLGVTTLGALINLPVKERAIQRAPLPAGAAA